MPYCYYTCNLLPTAFLARAGYEPRWFGSHPSVRESAGRFDSPNVHPMTCPFVTRLVTAAEPTLAAGSPEDRVVVPGGCDAMRRAGELLASQYPYRVWTLRLPRFADEGALAELTQELERMDRWLRDSAGKPRQAARLPETEAGSENNRRGFALPSPTQPGGVFVVGGPFSDASLLEFIMRLGSPISGVESCTAPARWQALDEAGARSETGTIPENDEGFEETARLILTQGVCPRRSSADRRTHLSRLLEEAQPSSVIYARQSFCDPGAYDALLVAELARERALPFLEVEVGFPLEVSGPLRTRVEAFLEAQLLDEDLLGESDQFTETDRSPEFDALGQFDELDDLLADELLEGPLEGDRPKRGEG